MLALIIAAMAAGTAGTPTTAQTGPQATPGDSSTVIVEGRRRHWDPNRRVCRDLDQPGSRLSIQRVCRTALEWQAERDENRQMLLLKQFNGAP